MRSRAIAACALVVLVGAACLTSCGDAPPPAKEVVRPVKLLTLSEPGLYRELSYPARVEAFKDADLSFLVSGRLEEIAVKRGQSVKKGDVLARLDPADYQNRYNAARAQTREREENMRRMKTLRAQNAAAQSELDAAIRSYDTAVAEEAIAKKALDDCVLRAPFDGEIGYQYKENYQDLNAKEPIFRLQNVDKLKIVIDVPENVRILLRRAEEARKAGGTGESSAVAVFEDLDEREFPVAYFEDQRAADPVTRTYAVTFVMDAPGENMILPGMSATVSGRVRVPTPADKPGFRLPAVAVVSAPGPTRYVWVQDPKTGTVGKRDVEVGSLVGSDIEVLDGLEIGDTVAVSGAHYLRDGQKVRALEYKAQRGS